MQSSVPTDPASLATSFMDGGGELGALMRNHDWRATPLGSPSTWPQSLKTALRILLTSRQPFWLGWGEALTYFYNDAHKSIIGGKHPQALGRPGSEVWQEIWDVLGPLVDHVMTHDEGTCVQAQQLIMERYGYPEETYYTFSYSPIPGDDGRPGGLICANTDETRQVIGERQLATLRELATRTGDARTTEQACSFALAALGTNRHDLPFALLYREEAPGRPPVLVAATDAAARIGAVESWPVGEVMGAAEARVLRLAGFCEPVPTGAWDTPPRAAVVLPIAPSAQMGCAGALVVGLNPFRQYDETYRGFLERVSQQIALALANAAAYEEERKRAELDRAKTAFFHDVSHEFRTPLTLMLGPMEELLSGANDLGEGDRERLEVIFAQLPVPAAVMRGPELRIEMANSAYCAVFGGRALIGQPLTRGLPELERQGLDALLRRVMTTGQPHVEREARLRLQRNGWTEETCWTFLYAPHRDARGVIDGVIAICHDVTEQVHARKAIERSEERYRRIFETARVSIWEEDFSAVKAAIDALRQSGVEDIRRHCAEHPEFVQRAIGLVKILDVNDATLELLGVEDKRALLRSLHTIFLPETKNVFVEELVAIAEGRSAFESEAIVRTPAGARREVLLTVAFGADPELRSVLVTLMDVTRRKHAEVELRDSQIDLQLTSEAAQVGTWAWNLESGELLWSLIHYKLWGLDPTDASLRYDDWARPIFDEDLVRAEVAIARCCQPGGPPYDVEYRIQAQGAPDVRWIRSMGRAYFDATGKAVAVRGVSLDITASKHAEEALREEANALETLNRVGTTLAAQLETEGIVQAATDAATEVAGAEFGALFYRVENDAGESYPLSTLSGAPRAVFEHLGMPGNTALFGPTFAGEGVLRLEDVTRDPRYGTSAPHHGMPEGHLPVRSYLAVPVVSRTGDVLGGLFFGHSRPGVFTERAERLATGIAAQTAVAIDNARLHEQREHLIRRLREADHRKDEFLATLAHELRNPLAPISNGLNLLRLASAPDGPHGHVHEIMDRQMSQLVRLVDDLLEVSRISRGVLELRQEPVELATIVRNARETSEPLIQAAGHRLTVSLPPQPIWLFGDPMRLGQILANLLNNAARYTDAGGEIAVIARAGPDVKISVRDTGMGISAEALPKIFEMFSRGDADTPGQGGLGIGLALARRLAEMHGGTIQSRSDGLGKGSEFVVSLPIYRGCAAEFDARVADGVPIPKRILVVDDNRDAADTLAILLRSLRADVRVAYDGAGALDAVESHAPAVVLLDIGMPEMDGYEVARQVRARFPDRAMVLVALTGWGQENDRAQARLAGFDHHLVKPADFDALKRLLTSIARGSPVSKSPSS